MLHVLNLPDVQQYITVQKNNRSIYYNRINFP